MANCTSMIDDPNGALAELKEIYLEVATEISPRAALAAMAVEKAEIAELIEDAKRVQREQPTLRETFAKGERRLLSRLEFLDSIADEVAFADCISISPDPHRGLHLVCSKPQVNVSAIADDDYPF